MTPSQAELLLRLAENRHAEGNEVTNEMRKMGTTYAQYLLEDEQMLIKALELNRQDQERFAGYMPQRPQTLNQALQRGPAIAQLGGRDGGGRDEKEAQAPGQGQRSQRPASGQ